ncbi:MAG: hypothetical protein KJO38_02960 [Gammaproteobacteria bacterium]|nr:hypothetical protein [Gammaproteobacteria bacterium]
MNSPVNQQGAALIVALIMLVVMTMLGLTSMNTTIIEERMAGNVRNKESSFEAAEAALRVGETTATGFDENTVWDGTNGRYLPEDDMAVMPLWQQGNWRDPAPGQTPNVAWQDRPGVVAGVAEQPEFVIENLGKWMRHVNCEIDLTVARTVDCIRAQYRVSARGWGANINAVSVVQSIFTQRL